MNAQEKWVGSKSLALLRQGPFRRYIIGSLISDSGTWMQMMAQSWVMSGLTSKAILLGLVNFAAGLPALILAPVAGSLADRMDKRKILRRLQRLLHLLRVSVDAHEFKVTNAWRFPNCRFWTQVQPFGFADRIH